MKVLFLMSKVIIVSFIFLSFEQGLAQAKQLAESGDVWGQVWQSSVFEDEHGVPPGSVKFTPWCNGVVWSINSAPGVAGEVTDYSQKFGPNYLKRYDDTGKGDLDGEYIDSAEAYVTLPMNYRRAHFCGMERPLCYSHDTRKVGIYKGMIGFEYVRGLSEEMHRRGKFTMANSTPVNWFWLTPLLDVLGTETDWKRGGKWLPMSRADLLYRRAMCGGKPYCFLMNSNFDNFSYEDSKRFMQRSLAMGFFPGFFSADASTRHYFENPALYNRDRPLFKKYIPLCRKLSEIGWEPVTGAEAGHDSIWVERFGKIEGERLYLTLFNDSTETQEVEVSATLFDPQRYNCRELVEDKEVKWQEGKAKVNVAAQGVLMLELLKR